MICSEEQNMNSHATSDTFHYTDCVCLNGKKCPFSSANECHKWSTLNIQSSLHSFKQHNIFLDYPTFASKTNTASHVVGVIDTDSMTIY